MNKVKAMVVSGALAVALSACNESSEQEAEQALELDTLDSKVSYIFGYDIASKSKQAAFTLDAKAIALAVNDVNSDLDSRLSEEEMRATMVAFQAEQQTKQQEMMAKMVAENTKAGADFLAENKQQEGVVTTASGLQYKELTSGDGPVPTAEDTVKVHYRGRLLDGTEFDSSYNRGEPAVFPVSNLIPGWVEGLQLMNVGDKWELYVPADLAYGQGGTGTIPPHSTLIFEMELLEILAEESASAGE